MASEKQVSVLRSFLELVAAFRVSYSDDTVMYIMDNGLGDIDDEVAFEKACHYALRNCRFMPSVAELRIIMNNRKKNEA